MKLSIVINSLDKLPKELHDYYEFDDEGRYLLQVSGMVPKSKLKGFRDSNIKLYKENKELKSRLEEADKEINELKGTLRNQQNNLNQLSIDKKIDEADRYNIKVVNSYRRYSLLRNKSSQKDIIGFTKNNKNEYSFGENKIKIEGRFIKIGRLKSESYEYIKEIELLIEILKNENLELDIFTFIQSPPYKEPVFNNFMEMDNLAVVPIKNYDYWWNRQIKDKTRNLVRKAYRNKVTVCKVKLDDEFIHGIHKIYNESPIRQGRPFPHFGKEFIQVKDEISTFLSKSDFIGAYHKNELIGFIKIVYSDKCANLMQILSMVNHRDKAPTNALLAKAVEMCAETKIDYLVYRKFIYGKKGADQLTEFKTNNGFIEYEIPRYYIAFTKKGKIALKMNLHHNILEIIPESIYSRLVRFRNFIYNKIYRS